MESVLKSVLVEELDRNRRKQLVFSDELNNYHKGSLNVVIVHGDKYIYLKYKEGKKVISKYIGRIGSEAVKVAQANREQYLKLKQDIKDLKVEEKNLIRMLKIYE